MSKKIILLVTLVFLIIAAAGAAMILGPVKTDLFTILNGSLSPEKLAVILNIRVPRIILALSLGAALAASGTVFQTLLRNPLADPYIIGVSGGAALGAAAGIVSGMPSSVTAMGAAAGALITVYLVHKLAGFFGFSSVSLILSGVALSFIFSSGVMLIFAFGPARDVHKALLWLMGDLSAGRFELMAVLIPVIFVIIILLVILAPTLDVMSMGPVVSKNLGVTTGLYRIVYWSGALLAALAVTLGGVVGFIGLVAPHVIRKISGPGHRILVPASALGGALFLLVCDTVGRTIVPPYEIPVGIITGFGGGLFFLLFMVRGMK